MVVSLKKAGKLLKSGKNKIKKKNQTTLPSASIIIIIEDP